MVDVDLLYNWENNTKNWFLSNTQTPFSHDTIKGFVENANDIYTDKQLRLMIDSLSDDRTVGTLDLFDCDFNNKRAGIGILIGERDDRRRGFGFEALEMVKVYARDVLNFHQLYANILESNRESISLFEKVGFGQCGVKKDWIRRGDKFEHENLYQIMLQ